MNLVMNVYLECLTYLVFILYIYFWAIIFFLFKLGISCWNFCWKNILHQSRLINIFLISCDVLQEGSWNYNSFIIPRTCNSFRVIVLFWQVFYYFSALHSSTFIFVYTSLSSILSISVHSVYIRITLETILWNPNDVGN